MKYNDTHLFVAIPKCASSSVGNFLASQGWDSLPPAPFVSWQHRPWCTIPEGIRNGRRPFAIVRDPITWYKSLYAYGIRNSWLGHWEMGRHHDPNTLILLLLDGKTHQHLRLPQKLEISGFWALLQKWDIGLMTAMVVLQCAADPGPFLARRVPPWDVDLAVQDFLPMENIQTALSTYLGTQGRLPSNNTSDSGTIVLDRGTKKLIHRKERWITELKAI